MKIEIELKEKDRDIELNIKMGLFTSCRYLDKDKPLAQQVGRNLTGYLKDFL